MTRFNLHQLRRIYDCFGLDDYCRSMNTDFIRVYTGHDNQRGVPCCYRFHPEELFLYSLTKTAKGNTNDDNVDHYFGGAYSRWFMDGWVTFPSIGQWLLARRSSTGSTTRPTSSSLSSSALFAASSPSASSSAAAAAAAGCSGSPTRRGPQDQVRRGPYRPLDR
eukprot:scaffold873_cov79-Skeletonema_dohrnii-CCMP3373.AAC.1